MVSFKILFVVNLFSSFLSLPNDIVVRNEHNKICSKTDRLSQNDLHKVGYIES